MEINALCIDGGGVLGIGPAHFLDKLEQQSGRSCLKQFDFFAGTSIGSVIAVLLMLDVSAAEITSLFERNAAQIFRRRSFLRRLYPFGPLYSNEHLFALIDDYCGQKLIAELSKPIYIPVASFDPLGSILLTRDDDIKIADALKMATAAPIFFDATSRYVDGGLWANNPCALALSKYLSQHEHSKAADIRLLSLGTMGDQNIGYRPKNIWPATKWLEPIYAFTMFGHEHYCETLMQGIGAKEYIRILPQTKRKERIDDPSCLQRWKELWESEWLKRQTAVVVK